MPRNRHRAAVILLAWMTLGFLASARAGHSAGRPDGAATDLGSAAASHCGGSPPEAPAPVEGTPCQWILPLLCCQQQAAADASVPALVSLGAFWIRIDASTVASLTMPRWSPLAATSESNPPALARSVVLQV